MKKSVYLQLWTLRREAEKDPEAVLRQVSSLGYSGIEQAGTYNWSLDKWKMILKETGLKLIGAHVGLPALEKDFDSQAAFQRELGSSRLVVPSLAAELRNAKGFSDTAKQLNRIGAELKKKNVELLYHNHAFEFTKLEGDKCGMDILLQETDPSLVKFEVDAYWVEKGGLDSWEFIKKHASRVGMIHAKELRKSDGANVAVGQGDIDFKSIVSLAREKDWPVIVEYEAESAIQAAEASAGYLNSL